MMANLKNYRLCNHEGVGQVVIKDRIVELTTITEEQAKFLFDQGSRYVEKVEPVRAPRTTQPAKDLVS
jgi:hypothetical protein